MCGARHFWASTPKRFFEPFSNSTRKKFRRRASKVRFKSERPRLNLREGGILKSDEANCQIQNHEISNPDLRFHDFGFGNLLRPISKFPPHVDSKRGRYR